MLAIDLDGVMLPDIHFRSSEELDMLLSIRSYNLHPIWQPTCEYYVITGRPVEDEPMTLKWFDLFVQRKPLKIFHKNLNYPKAKEYKLRVLNDTPEITMFIESDLEQSEFLKYNVYHPVKIINFSEFICESVNRL